MCETDLHKPKEKAKQQCRIGLKPVREEQAIILKATQEARLGLENAIRDKCLWNVIRKKIIC